MKRKKNDYRAFLKKSGIKARDGKQVYISQANHRRMFDAIPKVEL